LPRISFYGVGQNADLGPQPSPIYEDWVVLSWMTLASWSVGVLGKDRLTERIWNPPSGDFGLGATAALPLRGESPARYPHVRGMHGATNVGIFNSDPIVYGDCVGSCQLALSSLGLSGFNNGC